jgi:hypothetical protein
MVAERAIGAPATHVYHCIADFERHHPRFLPSAFSQFRVEEGGVGAGTVHSFKMTAGGLLRTNLTNSAGLDFSPDWSPSP